MHKLKITWGVKEIRSIVGAYEEAKQAGEKMVLATVVNVEESSYRRIGARMLIRSSGIWTGGISGGCLEGDALRRAHQVIFRNQATLAVYDLLEDDPDQIGVGLGCNGRIEVLLTPVNPDDPDNAIEQLKKIIHSSGPSVMLQVIGSERDHRLLGRTHLIHPLSGNIEFLGIGTQDLSEALSAVLEKRTTRIYPFTIPGQGTLKVLIEFIRPETQLIIVGDNYDINAMTNLASDLGWKLTLIGKKRKLTSDTLDKLASVITVDQAAALDVNEYTAVVLMSHDLKTDTELLPLFIAKKPAYLGILGPKTRLKKLLTDLESEAGSPTVTIHGPAGLDLGSETPEEIALSILAEILVVFRQKEGLPLFKKEGSIHDRDIA